VIHSISKVAEDMAAASGCRQRVDQVRASLR